MAQGAPGTPAASARQKYQIAAGLADSGDYEQALARIDEGLAIAPKDLLLLRLRGAVLLKLRDYAAALAAYQVFLAAGARGADRHDAQKIVDSLRAVQSTFLDITSVNGPIAIYLDSRTLGAFCAAAPPCHKPVLPGDYKVIAERAGFEPWIGRVTVETDQTARLAVTLVELPSELTVRVAQPGARVAIDGAAVESPITVAAGKHQVVVSLAGHVDARLEATAREGKPVELDVSLTPLPPVRTTLVPQPPARIDEPTGVRKVVGIRLVEVGGAALGAFYIHSLSATSDPTTGRVLLAAGAAAAVAGGVLWLTAPSERRAEAARIVPIVDGAGAGVAVVGRF